LRSKDEKDDVTISALFGLNDTQFRDEKEDLHYAMARFFCQWLDSKGRLWDFYHAYRDHAEDDPKGTKAFAGTLATGTTPEAANAEWTHWVLSLRR
jgi:hypothetical protein